MNRSARMDLPGSRPRRRGAARRARSLAFIGAVAILLAVTAYGLWFFLRPQPKPVDRVLFPGVHYWREARTSPRPLVIHRIDIDLKVAHPHFVISHGNGGATGARSLRVSTFLHDQRCQIAINGGFYELGAHAWSGGFTLAGDPVQLIGLIAANGTIYSPARYGFGTLYASAKDVPSFSAPAGPVFDAISGGEMVVRHGKLSTTNQDELSARTAVGLDERHGRMVIVVIDGKQPGYSEGVTLVELGSILEGMGVSDALCFDGGGSSTLAVQGERGRAMVLNSPTNLGIVGLERPVGDCLGIYVGFGGGTAPAAPAAGPAANVVNPNLCIADNCWAVRASAE